MEHTKGSRYLPTTTQLQEEGLKLPLISSGPSGGSPSGCRISVSKVILNLVVALLLLSVGMLMYNTNCSFFAKVSMDDSSKAPHSKSAHFESISSTAAEIRLPSRLRGIAQYLSMSPAAIDRSGAFQLQLAEPATDQTQVHYDAASPNALELLPKDSVQDQVLPWRGLAQVEQMKGEPKWPNLEFQQKIHPMPNGPDPIHNR